MTITSINPVRQSEENTTILESTSADNPRVGTKRGVDNRRETGRITGVQLGRGEIPNGFTITRQERHPLSLEQSEGEGDRGLATPLRITAARVFVVDLGIVNPAVTSDGETLPRPIRLPGPQGKPDHPNRQGSGGHVNSDRYRNLKLRRKLQQKGIHSAKRLLHKRSGSRGLRIPIIPAAALVQGLVE